jgi:hypothetical protein
MWSDLGLSGRNCIVIFLFESGSGSCSGSVSYPVPDQAPNPVNFLKFIYENVPKIKNKPDPALLQNSYLSKDIKKDTRISFTSKKTIPLTRNFKLGLSTTLYTRGS